eukprot:GHVQ01015729.1.p1 GENE.GHVQ01015729.1~~GHVQ01015729.1.p1  ORF type:complete len:414 (-),score=44.23 GHVQ01015729.1:1187-2428(-)
MLSSACVAVGQLLEYLLSLTLDILSPVFCCSSVLISPVLRAVTELTVTKDVDWLSYVTREDAGYWTGKVAWITGASTGIGAAVARALAERNVPLVLSARSQKDLEQRKAEITAASPLTDNDVLVLPIEMADLNSIPEAVQRAIGFKGKIHILFNNAGMLAQGTFPKWKVTEDILDVNLLASMRLCQEILPHFRSVSSGNVPCATQIPEDCHFVFTNSGLGLFSVPGVGAYSTSKHALKGYARGLHDELLGESENAAGLGAKSWERGISKPEDGSRSRRARRIYVTSVYPGLVNTAIVAKGLDGEQPRIRGIQAAGGNGVAAPQNPAQADITWGLTAGVVAERLLTAVSNKRDEAWIARGSELAVLQLAVYAPDAFLQSIRLLSATFCRIFQKREGIFESRPELDCEKTKCAPS